MAYVISDKMKKKIGGETSSETSAPKYEISDRMKSLIAADNSISIKGSAKETDPNWADMVAQGKQAYEADTGFMNVYRQNREYGAGLGNLIKANQAASLASANDKVGKWDEDMANDFYYQYAKDPQAALEYRDSVQKMLEQDKLDKKLDTIEKVGNAIQWTNPIRAGILKATGNEEKMTQASRTAGALLTGAGGIADLPARWIEKGLYGELPESSKAGNGPLSFGAVSKGLNERAIQTIAENNRNLDVAQYDTLSDAWNGGKNVFTKIGNSAAYLAGVENLATYGYQTLYSMGQSLASAPFGTLGLIALGGNAASQTFYDNAQNENLNDYQKLGYATAAGIFESLFEKISLDNVIKVKDVASAKDVIFNFLKSSAIEASEEACTELANQLTGALMLGNESDYGVAKAEYLATHSGATNAEASGYARAKIVDSIIASAIGGAISGGPMSLGGTGVNYAMQRSSAGQIVNEYNKAGKASDLYENLKAMQTPTGGTYADKITPEFNKKAYTTAVMQANKGVLKTSIENRLLELGVTVEESQKASEAVYNAVNDFQMTREQKQILKNPNVQQAIEEMRSGASWLEGSINGPIAEEQAKQIKDFQYNAFKEKWGKTEEPKTDATNQAPFSDATVDNAFNNYKSERSSAEPADWQLRMRILKEKFDSQDLSDEEVLKNYSTTAGIKLEDATAQYNSYKANVPNATADQYVNLAELAYEYGKTGLKLADVSKMTGGVVDSTLQSRYEAGLKAMESNLVEQNKNRKARTESNVRFGYIDEETAKKNGVYTVDVNKMSDRQKTYAKVIESLYKSFNTNVAIFDGRGKSAQDGWYDPKTNTLYVDITAGTADRQQMLRAFAHELTHSFKVNSPNTYAELKKFILDYYYNGNENMALNSIIRLSGQYQSLTNLNTEEATEELVARACERVFDDAKAISAMAQTNPGLFNKVKAFIEQIFSDLKKALSNLSKGNATVYSRVFDEKALNHIRELFAKAAQESTEYKYVNISEDGTVEMSLRQYNDYGREELINYYTSHYSAQDANDLIESIDLIAKAVNDIMVEHKGLSILSQWEETSVRLDSAGHPIFSSSVANGDYKLNQDFSRVCKKRRQLNYVLNLLAKNPDFMAEDLTKEDFVKINAAIKNRGFEIACALCFVDAKRFRQSEWAVSFASTYNDLLNSMVTGGAKTSFDFATDNPHIGDDGVKVDLNKPISFRKFEDGKVKETKHYKNFNDLVENEGNSNVVNMAKLIAENPKMRHTFRSADIISSAGFDAIQNFDSTWRGILDGWGGASVPKPSSLDTSYDSSILTRGDYNAETAFHMGGMRMQSFSDFLSHMFFDYCQAITDASAKGLPIQAYTKELDFAVLFGLTGAKINMSGIPSVQYYDGIKVSQAMLKEYAGLDLTPIAKKLGKPVNKLTKEEIMNNLSDAEYMWADESIDMKKAILLQSGIRFDKLSDKQADKLYKLIKEGNIEEAQRLAGDAYDARYTKHLGTIVVGISPAHIIKLLRDPTVRMVIPYHKSGINDKVAEALKINFYNDYTLKQNTSVWVKDKFVSIHGDIGKKTHLVDFDYYDYFGQTVTAELAERLSHYDGINVKAGDVIDARTTANIYKEWCEKGIWDGNKFVREIRADKKTSYVPASQYKLQPKFNEFKGEENYYKVLEDFDCYDTTTNQHSAQEAVQMVLPDDYKEYLVKCLEREQDMQDRFHDEFDKVGKSGKTLAQEIMDIVDKRTLYKNGNAIKARTDIDFNAANPVNTIKNGKVQLSARVTDEATLDSLNEQVKNGDVVEVYRAMQVVKINGKDALVPPMAGKVKVDGKWVWQNPSELGVWEQSEEISDFDAAVADGRLTPTTYSDGRPGYSFKLKKGQSGMTDVPAAYNPYIHTSLSALNDQFTSAYKRPNLRVVKGYVPKSELTSGYQAQYAKDAVGKTHWHSGVVAGKMPATREVILSRYFMPVEILDDSVTAKLIKKQMQGMDITIPYNVVSPSLRRALENEGINIGEGEGLANLPPKDSVKYSQRDSEGNTLSSEQQEYFKDSKIRDEDGNLKVVWHGSYDDFTVFDKEKSRKNADIQGFFFSPWDVDAGGYGPNLRSFYINITNPAPENVARRVWSKFAGQNEAGVKAREELIRLGYDGVNNSDEEYIAFYPEQIKETSNKKPTTNPDIRYSYRDGTPVELGTLFSGADTFASALGGLIHTQFAAENRPEIVAVYKQNHGGVVFNDVLKINPKDMPDVQHLHVSPPCVNLSAMNNDRGEKNIDVELAGKVAEIIKVKRPRAFTLENVTGYADTAAMKLIQQALKDAGYKDVDIGTYKDSDYGGYTRRARVILRAMRDEKLPAVTGKVTKAKGWGEAVGMDYLKNLPDSTRVNPRMIESLKNISKIDPYNVYSPLLVFGESYKDKSFGHAYFKETLPTIIAETGASKVFLPGGIVKEATPELLAKIMGLDGFKLPESKVTARRVIGNGIPAAITKNVMGPVIETIKADNDARTARGEDIKYSFRGESTATSKTDQKNLSLAKEMLDSGIESEKVRFATGWFKGYDGKWRNEIDDSGARILIGDIKQKAIDKAQKEIDKIKADYKAGKYGKRAYENKITFAKFRLDRAKEADSYTSRSYTLGELLYHPKLFKLYPQLKDVTVSFYSPKDGTLGYHSKESNYIGLKDKLFYNPNEMLSTVMHEVQHAIQSIEGFARGSNLVEASADQEDLINAERRKYQPEIREIEDRVVTKIDHYIDTNFPDSITYTVIGKEYEGYAQYLHDYAVQKTTRLKLNHSEENAQYDLEKAKEYPEFDQAMFDEIDRESAKLSDIYKKISDYVAEIKNENVFDRYQRTAGEIESRDVQARLGYDAETRKQTAPDVYRDNAIVKFALREFEDGTRFVDVETDQSQFDGLSPSEELALATKIIRSKFQNRVIGIDNPAFVNRVTANEYGHPAKFLDDDIADAKARASTELDNIVDAGRNKKFEPDGLYGHTHPGIIGFETFDAIFKVGNRYYEGKVNIILNQRGRLLKDITKIRDITSNTVSSYGQNPKSNEVRNASMRHYTTNSSASQGENQNSLRESIDDRMLLAESLSEHIRNEEDAKTVREYLDNYKHAKVIQAQLDAIDDQLNGIDEPQLDIETLKERRKKLNRELSDREKKLNAVATLPRMQAIIKAQRKAIADYEDALLYQKEKSKEDIAKLRAKMSDKIAAEIDRRHETMEAYRQRVLERKGINYYKPRIAKLTKELADMAQGNGKIALPEPFRAPVNALLANLDFTTKDNKGNVKYNKSNWQKMELQQAFATLAKQNLSAEDFLDKYGMDVPEQMHDWIRNISDWLDEHINDTEYNIANMTSEQLEELYDLLKTLKHSVKLASEMYTSASMSIGTLGTDTIQYLKTLGIRKENKVLDSVDKFFAWDNAQPYTVFKRFGPAGEKLWEGWTAGQDKMGRNQQEILDWWNANILTSKEMADKIAKWRTETVPVEIGGAERQIPIAFLMEFKCLMDQPDSYRHIVEGFGMRFDDYDDKEGKKKIVRHGEIEFIDIEDAANMINALTDEQKAIADKMHEYITDKGAYWYNAISVRRFGFEEATTPRYYPIRTIKGDDYEVQAKDETPVSLFAGLNKSWTKRRNANANNALVVGDIFETFSKHMGEMATYNAFALPMLDTIKWLNYKSAGSIESGMQGENLQDAIRLAYGKQGTAYIANFIKSANGKYGKSEDGAFLKGMRMYNRVAVGANIRVAIQQPFSIVRAFDVIDPKWFGTFNVSEIHKERMANSGISMTKEQGYFDTNVSLPLLEKIAPKAGWERTVNDISDKAMFLAEKGDTITWDTIWAACRKEQSTLHPELKGEELIQATSNRFDEIIYATQVVDSVLTKSDWMRNRGFLHKITSSFKSEPTTTLNTLIRLTDKMRYTARTEGMGNVWAKNKSAITRTLTVFAATQIVNAIVTALIDAMRDDDDYETFADKYLSAFKGNLWDNVEVLSSVPYVSDIIELLKGYDPSRPDMELVQQLIKTGKSIESVFKKKSLDYKTVYNLINSASSISGIPAGNAMRDAVSIYNTFIGSLTGKRIQTSPSTNKSGYTAFYDAYKKDKMQRATALIGEMQNNGIEDKTIWTGLYNMVKDDYIKGKMTYDETLEYLATVASLIGIVKTEKDIRRLIDGWK